jgi:uncharacterized membrane-anchored protein YhcB (DUF1043 family)
MTTVYKWIATCIALLAIVGIIYGKGRLDSQHAAELADVQAQLTAVQTQVLTEKEARISDAKLAKADADRLSKLNSDIDGLNAYVDALQDADRECLSGADTERLRQLWQ